MRELGRGAEARDAGQIVLEGPDLGLLEAHLDSRVKALLQDFKPNTAFEGFPRPEARRKIAYEGRTLDLDLHFDSKAMEIYRLISVLETVKEASKEHLRFLLVFRRGMTRRGDHVIRILQRQSGLAAVQQIAESCRRVLDEEAVRAAIRRLEELGYVRCSGDEVRLTAIGKYQNA